jgi:ubiquitin C-terminal hydrolase
LDLFIRDDVLEGENKYFCEQLGQKIRAAKRCFFKELPPVFVVTLKRFEFELNKMTKSKVNDYFEFPLEIALDRWTRPDE